MALVVRQCKRIYRRFLWAEPLIIAIVLLVSMAVTSIVILAYEIRTYSQSF